ncbi:FAD-dependent oxidoreductase [Bifidobacterium sp. 82T24]|uniref:FAD-dependent oxidoreductase n=1 Tax=Bifidobacterium pluvialisilvae TaxID=2834436 RepID=UPI001C5787F3|nr:FAD-dependent oxidoreductase [Bifidobacterium pluvialisilvae]MBW3087212.1 FAD-dependent oxidoreductase [Bifidobacterium pluvialisilvae]
MTDTVVETDSVDYDVVIVGAGPGGYSAALRARELGLHVALVERDERPGGTCLNRGCIPTKALITAARSVEQGRHASRYGIDMSVNGIDFGALRDYRRKTVRTVVEGLSGLLRFRGVDMVHGEANAVERVGDAAYAVTITSQDDAPHIVTARHVIVATGSRPRPLPGIPFSQSVIDSDAALELDEFPDDVIIVGSGAVALEFASLWNAAGSRVTLLARRNGVLSNWDRRTSATMTRELKRRGIDVVTHAGVTGMDTGVNLGAAVHYRVTSGKTTEDRTTAAQIVLVAIGRDPNTDAPWFDGLGIARDDAGYVSVDGLGRTNLANVWAVGDITGGYQLAHRAFEQGIVAAEAIAGLDPSPVREETIPRVVFSSPEAAAVGLTKTQAQADDRYEDVTETIYPMTGNARTLMTGENGSVTVIGAVPAGKAGTARVVVGVHMVGPEVNELAGEAEQLVGNAVPLSDAARLIHPHPTFGEALGEALLKADGRPLHMR